ncbi:MAG: zinc metallopeptidase [Candidatus Dormibacteria bacterium]
MGYFPFFISPTYILFMLPALALGAYAQWKVKSAYARWEAVPNSSRLNGMDMARRILNQAGLQNVGVEVIPGELTDNYDPSHKVLRLSEPVAHSATVASEGIVAHEIGHAVQDHASYVPMRLRASLVPVANLGQQFAWLLIFAGLMLSVWVQQSAFGTELAYAGLVLFAGVFVFQLVTLPVEMDASRRALALLRDGGMMQPGELDGARQVLGAAALTYLAAVIASLATFLYYASLVSGRRSN